MLKTASKTWWKAVIRDMLLHVAPAELKAALKERYPQLTDLVQLVDEVVLKQADIKGFCKRAQDFGFGYGNTGQTNFSVPNSEGSPGAGFDQIDPSSPFTPGSSYTDFAKFRLNKKKEEKELAERRKRRKELTDKMAAAKPGQSLKSAPGGTKPGAAIEDIVREVDDKLDVMNRATRATEKEHEIAPEWSAAEQAGQEQAVGDIPVTTAPPPVGPGVKAPAPQAEAPKGVSDAAKTMDDVRKKMKSTVDEGVKETKTLSDAAKQTTDNINTLNKSVQQLLG